MVEIQDVTEDENQTVRNRRNNEDTDNEVEVQEGQEGPVEELSFDEQVRRERERMQPSATEKFMAMAKSLILRALVVYFIMSFLRGNTSKPSATNSTSDGQTAAPAFAASNVYPNGTEFDLYVYVSEDGNINKLNFTNAELVWKQEGLIYGDWYGGPNGDGTFTQDAEIRLSKKVQNNGTIFIHTFFVPLGYTPFHSPDDSYAHARTVHGVRQLNKFKRRKYHKTQNLLTGETSATPEEQEKAKVMTSSIESHWHPNITINVVTDWTSWTPGHVPAPLNQYVNFIPKEHLYQPVLFYNDYWNLGKDYQPINDTTSVLPLTITYQPLSLMKWQLYAAQTMRNQWHQNLLMGAEEEDDDQDALKEAILDTNPYLLGLTFVISILHSIFEFLAFKNDIQFWNNRKSLEGLSVRSVFFNVFQSVIVLLYVLDNETNFVIKISVGVGLLIEIWKINKVLDIKVDKENPIFGIIPRVKFSDKGSYVESDTKIYDQLAFRYLSWALFPLLIGYSVYSLVYFEQKGWYSFVLNLLYGFLLTFGFIMMTPQLFINYKLKSVAHLPWRMLSYKFLNTFIDDIFAFVIKMPTMYRIGTLRDDIIFFIFLYQRWVYRVDHTRVNEFGFTGEELDNKATPTPEVEGDVKTPSIEDSGPAAKQSPPKSDAKKSTKQSKKDKKNQ